MKKCFLLIIILASFFKTTAQTIDSISTVKSQNKILSTQLIAPTLLIGCGFLLKTSKWNTNLQNDTQKFFGRDFSTPTDNILPFIPITQIYAGKFLGFEPKNDVQHQTINIIISNLVTYSIVASMKHSFEETRPDRSDNLSFPSGHTALAFNNAAILYYEYKGSNIWYASSGFLFASATGILRIANNKHFASDVLTGAGIGLGVGLVITQWNPFKFLTFGNNKTHAILYPQIGKRYGVGLIISNRT